jgi:hypothetical protein
MLMHVHERLLESALIPVRADRVRRADVPRAYASPAPRYGCRPVSTACPTATKERGYGVDIPSYLAIGAIAILWLGAEFFAWYRTDRRHR